MITCRHDPVAIQESSSVHSTKVRQPLRVNPFTGYVLLHTSILKQIPQFRNPIGLFHEQPDYNPPHAEVQFVD
jgi:hypothetical protein